MLKDRIPLTRVASELRREYGAEDTTYRKVYNKVLDGDVQTEQINGRHYVDRSNLAAIAVALSRKTRRV